MLQAIFLQPLPTFAQLFLHFSHLTTNFYFRHVNSWPKRNTFLPAAGKVINLQQNIPVNVKSIQH